jgi:hypothetical protein
MTRGLVGSIGRYRRHRWALFGLYATLFAVAAFARTRPVLLVNDGHMYFEMARSMSHGSLEFRNGLDAIDSPELWMQNAVKIGRHLYSKYPPLYAFIGAAPYALFGIRGLYLVNAIAFVFALPAMGELARRALGPTRGFVATWAAPWVLPLVPYMLMELPHLVALAPFLWSVVAWDASRRAETMRRALGLGAVAGLLAGVAVGVRVQDIVLTLPLFGVGWRHSRRPRDTLGGLGAGLGAVLGVVALLNERRFGTPNPFSYGPSNAPVGAPPLEERASFFLQPSVMTTFAIVVVVLVAARACRRVSWAWATACAGVIVIALVPPLRAVGERMVACIASFLVNANVAGAGWWTPDTTHGWVDKALLASTPFLALGLVGAGVRVARGGPPLLTALAWMSIALVLFLSVREADPRTERAVIGFLSLSPRYLVEIMPALYLLAWDQLRGLRFDRPQAVRLAGLALATGAVLLAYMVATGEDDLVPAKLVLISTASVAGAGMLVVAWGLRSTRLGACALAGLVAVTSGYALACAYGEDGPCLLSMPPVHERWGKRILAAMPEPRVAVVGWRYAKDAIFHVRASKDVVIVDPSVDDAATLAETLDALVASGRKPYYFGLELDRVRPRIEARYRVVPVLDDPLLWRFDRIDPGERRDGS